MSDLTLKPTPGEQLNRLSRLAEDLHGMLSKLDKTLDEQGLAVPPHVLTGLRQLSGSLKYLNETYEDFDSERRNLFALAEIGQVVNSSLDLETVLNEVIDTIIRLTGAERAFLMLRDDADPMKVMTARNWERESLAPGEYEFSRTITERVMKRGESILTTNAREDPRFESQESIIAYNLRSILCVPLKVKQQLIGVIYSDNTAKAGLFSEKDRMLLTNFANQAAVAIENARLFASVQQSLEEVTELKNLMEDVFASITSGVITADIDRQITLCNKAAEMILASSAQELLQTSLSDLLAVLSEDLNQNVQKALEEDARFDHLEIHPKHIERGDLDLSLSITPLKTTEDRTRGVTIVMDDLTEKRRLQAQRRLFDRMVSPAVIDQLDPDTIQLGGEITETTILFADIRGYTAFSATMDPKSLVEILNRYLSAAAEAVLEQEGTIDKFLGDAVMAWFNAPIPQPDHSLRAGRAALGIRRAVNQLNASGPAETHLTFGIGLHCGEALLGLVGSQKRLDYTAIGETVNIAKRLQENAGPGQILVSGDIKDALLGRAGFSELEPLKAHGVVQEIPVFELHSLSETLLF